MDFFNFLEFDVLKLPKWLRKFCPYRTAPSVKDIDLKQLVDEGKKLILVDIDNTLVQWDSDQITPEVLKWLQQGQSLGLKFYFVSNTNRTSRLGGFAEQSGVAFTRGRFKPSRQMFFQAMALMKEKSHETVMIGDQLLTDVLGANRAGIKSIWTKPLAQKEFLGTKLSRLIEKIILQALKKAIKTNRQKNDKDHLVGLA